MYIAWGTYEKLKNDLSTGIDWCPNCRKFTGWYIGRRVRIKHVEYIPLKTTVLERYEMCGKCNCGRNLTLDSYEALKRLHEPFKKRRQQIKCFEKAAAMAENSEISESAVNTIFEALAAEYPLRSTPQLESEYRRRIGALLTVHGRGGSPDALMQPAEPEPQTAAPQKSAVMDEI